MDLEGPPLETLLHRIAETPADFLPGSQPSSAAPIAAAIIHDVAASLGVTFSAADLATFPTGQSKLEATQRSLSLLLCWLLADEWFSSVKPTREALLELLQRLSADLAPYGSASTYLQEPDRREELSRLALAHFGYRPAGESKAQAQDRLNSLSVVERARVLRASKQAEERARAIRAALAKKAADEAADKWTRE